MSITVELTPEEEMALRNAAEGRGQSVEYLVKDLALQGARQLLNDYGTG